MTTPSIQATETSGTETRAQEFASPNGSASDARLAPAFRLCDNCLRNFEGHDATLAIALLGADQKLLVFANAQCELRHERIVPLFRMGLANKRIQLLDVHQGWRNKIITGWRVLRANLSYYGDLRRANRLRLGRKPCMLIIANGDSRCVFGVFFYALFSRDVHVAVYLQTAPTRLLGKVGRLIRFTRLRRFAFAAETQEQASGWEQMLGVPVWNIPFPTPPRQTDMDTSIAPDRPVELGLLGGPRLEKGFAGIPDLCQSLEPELRSGRARLLIQVAPAPPGGLIEETISRLLQLAEQIPGIQLIRQTMDESAYGAAWRQVSGVILPYSRDGYAARSSGILIEAISGGKPVVVTEGTLLARFARQHGAACSCIEGEPASLAAACRRLIAEFATFEQLAAARAAAYNQQFNPPRFLEQLAALANK